MSAGSKNIFSHLILLTVHQHSSGQDIVAMPMSVGRYR